MAIRRITPESQSPIEQQRPSTFRPYSAGQQPDMVQSARLRQADSAGDIHAYGSEAADRLEADLNPNTDPLRSLLERRIHHVITTPAPVHWVDYSRTFVAPLPAQPVLFIPANPRRRGLIFQNNNSPAGAGAGNTAFISFGQIIGVAGSLSSLRIGLSPPVQVLGSGDQINYFPIIMGKSIISTDDVYLSWFTDGPPDHIVAYEAIDAKPI